MKYLILTEFGDFYSADEITDDMRQGVNGGVLDVINTKEMEVLTAGDAGHDDWEDIPAWHE